MEMDPDDNLPWPELALVQKWWDKNRGQFQNGTWYVNVRDVRQVTHERPRAYDSRRGEVYPRDRFVR